MIKSIKEFYNIFVEAYHKFYALKFKAKDSIELYEIEIDTIKRVKDKMRNIYFDINSVYKYFPITERQDFVSKTSDLLFYGRCGKDGEFIDSCSWMSLYHNQHLTMKNNYKILKSEYKQGHYYKVIVLAEEYNTQLDNFYKTYNIKENHEKEKHC